MSNVFNVNNYGARVVSISGFNFEISRKFFREFYFQVMSEDIFDAEIRKKNQNESDRTKDRAGEKKRPSVVESSDEDPQPATKKSRKNSDVSGMTYSNFRILEIICPQF